MEAGAASPGRFSSGAMGFLLVIHDAHGLSEEQKGAATAAMKRKRERTEGWDRSRRAVRYA